MKKNLENEKEILYKINVPSSSLIKVYNNRKFIFLKNSIYFKIKSLKRNNIIILFLFLISYFLYYLSLEKCLDGEDGCCIRIKWITKKIIELIISCLLISFLLQLIILNQISKLHLLHLIIVFFYFHNYSHGLVFSDHGYFNFICFISLLISILILLSIFKIFFILLKKYKHIFITILHEIMSFHKSLYKYNYL